VEIHEHGYWPAAGAEKEHLCSPKLAAFLMSYLDRNVPTLDLGCGLGTYLMALQNAGFTRLRGFEGDPPLAAHFAGIERHDLTLPLTVAPPGNVICLEVAEHIPAAYADVLLDSVAAACADRLVLSWAIRGQGGRGHCHELDNFEVLPMLMGRGFSLDMGATRQARDLAGADLGWFSQSLFAMRKAPVRSDGNQVWTGGRSGPPRLDPARFAKLAEGLTCQDQDAHASRPTGRRVCGAEYKYPAAGFPDARELDHTGRCMLAPGHEPPCRGAEKT
jgi:hypothetical protein